MKPGRSERYLICYGEEKEPAPALNLRSGPVSVLFESGFLRYFKINEHEFLRMIYYAVRDHNWDTIEGEVKDLYISAEALGFRISYTSIHRKGPVDIIFKCLIRGDESGNIEFSIEGIAGSTFKKNRIGFCVLHPITGCIGKPCTIQQENGIQSELKFPVDISPHQPFRDIKSMKWGVNKNYQAKLIFHGDVFETEDQRNWTDASYKTYCTPLDIPFPVAMRPGDSISQKVVLEMIPLKSDIYSEPEEGHHLSFSIGEEMGFNLPGLGCSSSSSYGQLDISSSEMIKSLQLEHVRWDLYLWKKGDLVPKIRSIQLEIKKLRTKACLALFFGENPGGEYTGLANTLKKYPFPIAYIILFSRIWKTTPDFLINNLVHRIRNDFPGVLLGGGTNAYFAELNRQRIENRLLDFIVYSVTPQVHAFDRASLTETLEAQAQTVKGAFSFNGGNDILISPITLKPRFNPNSTREESPPPAGVLPSQVDIRQMSLYTACWTLISIKYLAEAGVKAITYFETAGWKGLIQGPENPPLPSVFRAEAGDIFPVYLVFSWLNKVKNGNLVRSVSSQPLIFDGLVIRQRGIQHIFLVNFSHDAQAINIKNNSGPYLVRSLTFDKVRLIMNTAKTLENIIPDEVGNIIMEPCSIQWINLKAELS